MKPNPLNGGSMSSEIKSIQTAGSTHFAGQQTATLHQPARSGLSAHPSTLASYSKAEQDGLGHLLAGGCKLLCKIPMFFLAGIGMLGKMLLGGLVKGIGCVVKLFSCCCREKKVFVTQPYDVVSKIEQMKTAWNPLNSTGNEHVQDLLDCIEYHSVPITQDEAVVIVNYCNSEQMKKKALQQIRQLFSDQRRPLNLARFQTTV
jgi:hypothetical protein